MPSAHGVPLQLWLAYWRYKQWYHRYTVEGLDHLDTRTSALIVGYHGRPAAWDLCMLTVALYERLGYLAHGVLNPGVDAVPALKRLSDALGFVTSDDASLAAAVRRGEHLIITPGGALEGSRSFRHQYQVDWGNHVGYLRIALKHNLRIVPVGAAGTDEAYIGLNNGLALGRRLGLRRSFGIPLCVGPLGLFPFSPPFPVRMRQLVGTPIDLQAEGLTRLDDRDGFLRLHRRVMSAVQALLDQARSRRR